MNSSDYVDECIKRLQDGYECEFVRPNFRVTGLRIKKRFENEGRITFDSFVIPKSILDTDAFLLEIIERYSGAASLLHLLNEEEELRPNIKEALYQKSLGIIHRIIANKETKRWADFDYFPEFQVEAVRADPSNILSLKNPNIQIIETTLDQDMALAREFLKQDWVSGNGSEIWSDPLNKKILNYDPALLLENRHVSLDLTIETLRDHQDLILQYISLEKHDETSNNVKFQRAILDIDIEYLDNFRWLSPIIKKDAIICIRAIQNDPYFILKNDAMDVRLAQEIVRRQPKLGETFKSLAKETKDKSLKKIVNKIFAKPKGTSSGEISIQRFKQDKSLIGDAIKDAAKNLSWIEILNSRGMLPLVKEYVLELVRHEIPDDIQTNPFWRRLLEKQWFVDALVEQNPENISLLSNISSPPPPDSLLKKFLETHSPEELKDKFSDNTQWLKTFRKDYFVK